MTGFSNASILRSVVRDAETLSCAAAGSAFPVVVRSLLPHRRVSSIEFQPLLVDAMLTTHAGGFRILLNSSNREPSTLRQDLESESASRTMQSRVRFSIAHELAHTFFYDIESSPPRLSKAFRAGGGRDVLENLERKCDLIAGHILMPTPLLRKSLLKLNSISPTSILDLAARAGVSIEALLRRLGDSSAILGARYFRGCIVLVQKSAEGVLIKAVSKARDLPLAQTFHSFRHGGNFQVSSSGGNALDPFGSTENLEVDLPLSTKLSTTLARYVVNAKPINSSNALITFEEKTVL